MNMYFTLLFIALVLSVSASIYQAINKPDVSIENGLQKLKKNLIRTIVYYQQNYNGSDQLVLIARWIKSTKDKIKNAPVEQKKLFKKLINEL